MQLAHQARTQASSRYPSYKRRLGTGCDSANFPSQTQYGKRRPTENGPFLKAWEQIAFSERKLKFQVVFSFIVLWSKELTRAPVVQKVESAIHRIKRYPRDSAIGFPNTYPLDSDLSARGGGGTPIHYLYWYVPPNGVVILKLLIWNGASISDAFSRTGYNISNARKLQFCKQPFEIIQGQIAFKNMVQCVNKQTVVLFAA